MPPTRQRRPRRCALPLKAPHQHPVSTPSAPRQHASVPCRRASRTPHCRPATPRTNAALGHCSRLACLPPPHPRSAPPSLPHCLSPPPRIHAHTHARSTTRWLGVPSSSRTHGSPASSTPGRCLRTRSLARCCPPPTATAAPHGGCVCACVCTWRWSLMPTVAIG